MKKTGFKIEDSVKADEVPKKNSGVRRDYTPILKAVATLEKGEALKLTVDKKHVVTGIRTAVKKGFRHGNYRVASRSIKGEKHKRTVYIINE